MKKTLPAVLLILVLSLATAPANEPRHPLSQIHPVDEGLNMSDRAVFNVSELRIRNGLRLDGNAIQVPADVDVLGWDSTNNQWVVKNADLSLNSNNINSINQLSGFFAGKCGSDQVITQVYSDGNYRCVEVAALSDVESLNTTLTSGSIANQSIQMNGNQIVALGDPDDPQDAATKSYVDESDDTIEDDQGLPDVLAYNDSTGSFDIDMNGNSITNYFASACPAGQVVEHVNDDGSFDCVSIAGETGDLYVNESGDTMSGDLDLGDHAIVNLSDPDDPQDAATKSYVDNSDDTIEDDQDLQDVLGIGNEAGGFDINMSGQDIVNIGDIGDVDSTDVVGNLNADLLDGNDASAFEEEGHAGEHDGEGLSNPSSDTLDVNTGNALTINTDSVAVSSGGIGSSELASNAVTSSGGELDSTVAGNELSLSSGALDVDEGSNSDLNADQLDGNEASYFEEEDHAGEHDGEGLSNPTGDTLDINAGNALEISSDNVAVSTGGVGSDELASNAVTSSGGELDSTVAGNELSLSSGALDVDEGSNSGLNADMVDGEEGAYYKQNLSDVLTQGNDADSTQIANLADPDDPQDAATKSYVDESDDTIADDQTLQDVLGQGNSTGTFNINMNGNSLLTGGGTVEITDSTNNQDIVRFTEGGTNSLEVPDSSTIDFVADSYDWTWDTVGDDVEVRIAGTGGAEFNFQADGSDYTTAQLVMGSSGTTGVTLDADGTSSFDGGSVEITNGGLTVSGNALVSDGSYSSSSPTLEVGDSQYGLSSSGGDLYLHSANQGFVFRNNTDKLLDIQPNGSVTVPRGAVNLAGHDLLNVGTLGDVDSTDVVGNLNADLLDGNDASYFEEEDHAGEHDGEGLSNPSSDTLDVNTGNALTINTDSVAVSSGGIGSSELASNAVTSSGGELDSTVAGNELSLSSGALDVDEGANSGLNADMVDGNEASAFCRSDGTNCPTDNTGTDDQTLSEVLTQGQDAGSQEIQNLADPTDPQDAATRSWVNDNDAYAADDQGIDSVLDNDNTVSAGGNNNLDFNGQGSVQNVQTVSFNSAGSIDGTSGDICIGDRC